MKFEWSDAGMGNDVLEYSIFSCSIVKWKEGWQASIGFKGGGLFGFGGGTSLGRAVFDNKEDAKAAAEATIVKFCREITQAAVLEERPV